MRPVAVRVLHGTRETVIDADGIRVQPASSVDLSFELEVTFQCATHESILRIGPEERALQDRGLDEPECLSALVGTERLERIRPPIGQAAKRAKRARGGVLQLIKSDTRRE